MMILGYSTAYFRDENQIHFRNVHHFRYSGDENAIKDIKFVRNSKRKKMQLL